jgi:quercetin dioxygenase-like cupin family protein
MTAKTLKTKRSEQGDTLQFGDVLMNRLVSAADLPSRISVQEWSVAPHFLGAPPHRHANEDEVFYVLEGEMSVMEEESVQTVKAGTYVLLPRGRLHGFWNAGDIPARMLVILTPGGLESYFPEAAQHADDLGAVMRTSAAYGMEFRMDLVPEIMQKYGLKSSIPAPPPVPAAESAPGG